MKSWLEWSIRLFFLWVCKYQNQRLRRIGEGNGKSFKDVPKTKKKKQTWRDWVSILSFYYHLLAAESVWKNSWEVTCTRFGPKLYNFFLMICSLRIFLKCSMKE